jgi:hypothetical protein
VPYAAEISRTSPSCFLFLIDQSGSMEDPLNPSQGRTKAQGVADAINRLLQNLVLRCSKSEGIRDYYDVGVIGYGRQTGPALSGQLAGQQLVPISQIGQFPARIEERQRKEDDGAGDIIERTIKFPVWFDPKSDGGTPMRQALGMARDILQQWITAHPNSFPPIVINITDGESTDGDPSDAMRTLTSLATSDGATLLFNVHLSGNPNATSVSFVSSAAGLPDQHATTMFNGASLLTPYMRQVASEHGFTVSEGARGFVLNADLTLVIQALDIGTRAANMAER